MYLKEIFTYLGWPVMIYLTYKLSVWAIKIYERKYPEEMQETKD